MTDELLAAIAERLNRLDEVGVTWDRCVLLDSAGVVYGWIDRDDGRADYVAVTLGWGETTALGGARLNWLAAGYSTSSAKHSARIGELLNGPDADHNECQRVEHVFGALVNRKVEL